MEIEEAVGRLCLPDAQSAYRALRFLLARSEESDLVYPYLDRFIHMMEEDHSYLRTRGLLLIAANARWDREGKVAAVIGRFLLHITDAKPITARQCIAVLPGLVQDRPEYRERVLAALARADTSGYADSMRRLVDQDIREAIRKLST